MDTQGMSLSDISKLTKKAKSTVRGWASVAANKNCSQEQGLANKNCSQEDGLLCQDTIHKKEQEIAESIAKKLERAKNNGNQPALFNLEETIAIIRVGNPFLADVLIGKVRLDAHCDDQPQIEPPADLPSQLPHMIRPQALSLPVRTDLSALNNGQVSSRQLYSEAQAIEKLIRALWDALPEIQHMQQKAIHLVEQSSKVVDSWRGIRNKEYTLLNAAQILGVKRKFLIEYMLNMKYLHRDSRLDLLPTRMSVEQGLCSVKFSSYDNGRDIVDTASTRVTGRGIMRLQKEIDALMLNALPALDDGLDSGKKLIGTD